MTNPRLGVVLFQLGGPDSPEAVEPFLYNLFCDPDIINFFGGWLARRPLAWWIAHRRAGIVREHYDAIGGQSPIRDLTERQARGLEQALAPDFDARCFIAMRYWHPLTQEAAAEPDRPRRSLPAPGRRDRRRRDGSRRLAQLPHALFSKPRRPAKMARALAHAHARTPAAGRE